MQLEQPIMQMYLVGQTYGRKCKYKCRVSAEIAMQQSRSAGFVMHTIYANSRKNRLKARLNENRNS